MQACSSRDVLSHHNAIIIGVESKVARAAMVGLNWKYLSPLLPSKYPAVMETRVYPV